MFCHIIHRAVIAVGQPFHQAVFRRRQIGIADAGGPETELARPRAYLRGKRRIIDRSRGFVLHNPDHIRIAFTLDNEEATFALARRIAVRLKPGMVIYLRGDLGAGKTALVRGALNALGYAGRVKSPTYTLLEPYEVAGLELRHFDLYRLRDEAEWEAAGFRDEFDGCNIFFIEWPERAQGLLPAADLEIVLEILPHGRRAEIIAGTEAGEQCAAQL